MPETVFTGIDRADMLPFPAEPRPEDLPNDPAYAVKPSHANSNWRMIAEAIGKTFWTGQHYKCLEGTVAYGASDSTHCRLATPAGYTELNDYLIIGDGTRVWRVQVSVENEIEFSDADLVSGTAGTANYDQIKDDLRFMTVSKEKLAPYITKHEICLGAHDDALHADDIRISDAIATTIKDLYDDYYIEHESDGTHSAGIIKNNNLDKTDILSTQGVQHLVKNNAFNINGAASIALWEYWGTPVTFKANENSPDVFPAFELEVESDDIDEGPGQYFSRGEVGVPLRLCFYAKGDSGGEKIKAILSDGVNNSIQEYTLTSSWAKYYHEFTPTTKLDMCVRILSRETGTHTWYIALVTLCPGDVHMLPERAPTDVVYDAVHAMNFFVSDLTAANQFAAWTLERDITILRIHAYAIAAVMGDTVLRLSDGSNNYDITISAGQHAGSNTSDQDYDAAASMTFSISTADVAGTGADCMIVVQYRMR